jgi:hypothetical protein
MPLLHKRFDGRSNFKQSSMKKSFLIVLLMIYCTTVMAQKDREAIQATVVGFFNGLSLIDADSLRHYSTADFELLEDGEVWNMDTLIKRIMPRKGSNVKRFNSFTFITTSIDKNRAWVSYHNTADFTLADKQRQLKWLESAVLVKSKGRWRIQLLHSTVKK